MVDNSISTVTPHANTQKVVNDVAVNSGEMAKIRGWDGERLGSYSPFPAVW